MVDGAAVAAEVGFHQWSLFLALFGASSAGSAVHIRLDHQRLLPLLLLLLFEQRSLWFRVRKHAQVERNVTKAQ